MRRFCQFTAPDGSDVWVVRAWVQIVREPIGGLDSDQANTVILMSGRTQEVREQPLDVVRDLEAAGD